MLPTFLLGVLVGLVLGVILVTRRRRRSGASTVEVYPALEHITDLVRRAHGAALVCLVRGNEEPIVIGPQGALPDSAIGRAVSAARLAMADAKEHIFPGSHPTVARGDGSSGIAVVLESSDVGDADTRAVSADLRRLLDHVPPDVRPSGPQRVDLSRGREGYWSSVDTLSGIAFGMCERAAAISGRTTAVVQRDPDTEIAKVVAVSRGADRFLLGVQVNPDSAVGRACMGDAPVIAGNAGELFGLAHADRRRRGKKGTAYPLRDGRTGVGALVVFGRHTELSDATWEQIMWLSVDSGPQFAAAAAVKRAEDRAKTDVLTGLPNRAALQEAMGAYGSGPCSILCVDIDHFKKLNDTLGHAAGDAALKHLARVFRSSLRDRDFPARIGGEEFALWLPDANQTTALEVAERVRETVAETRWEWAGSPVAITCSIGVASCPETATQIANLLPTADAALYRAKRGGRNRVEVALSAAGSGSCP